MRVPLRASLLLALLAVGCGGGDSTDPADPFPDASGVYQVSGGFDGLSSGEASFEGTLTLEQASQESGALTGSASFVATIGTDVFSLSDDDLSNATVSTAGVVSFTMVGGGTWTFTGTLVSGDLAQGRHTLSAGSESASGDWTGTRVGAARASRAAAIRTDPLAALSRRVVTSAEGLAR